MKVKIKVRGYDTPNSRTIDKIPEELQPEFIVEVGKQSIDKYAQTLGKAWVSVNNPMKPVQNIYYVWTTEGNEYL